MFKFIYVLSLSFSLFLCGCTTIENAGRGIEDTAKGVGCAIDCLAGYSKFDCYS